MCRRWFRSFIALLLPFVSQLCHALPRPEHIKLDDSPNTPALEAVQPQSQPISTFTALNVSLSSTMTDLNLASSLSSPSSSSPSPRTFPPSSSATWTAVSFNSLSTNSSLAAASSSASSSSSSSTSSSSPPENSTLSQCQPSRSSCSFYPCIENLCHCGSKGYPMAYGDEYCTRYQQNYHEFSAQGQAFISQTQQCLQQNLTDALSSHEQMSCSRLSATAFTSHADCYVRSGFCDLQVGDLGWIAYTVGPSYFSSLSNGVQSAMSSLDAVQQCSDQWETAVHQVLVTLAHGFGSSTS